MAQYEKPLTKGHKTTLREKREKDPEKIAKRKTEKRERSQVHKERDRDHAPGSIPRSVSDFIRKYLNILNISFCTSTSILLQLFIES